MGSVLRHHVVHTCAIGVAGKKGKKGGGKGKKGKKGGAAVDGVQVFGEALRAQLSITKLYLDGTQPAVHARARLCPTRARRSIPRGTA